jgi:hypothetical protein
MLKITFFPLHFLSFFLHIKHSGNHLQVGILSFRSWRKIWFGSSFAFFSLLRYRAFRYSKCGRLNSIFKSVMFLSHRRWWYWRNRNEPSEQTFSRRRCADSGSE